MSGDHVMLAGTPDGAVAALVRAAGTTVEHAGVRAAIIGGLAVTCRLAVAHRATGDVDVVADDRTLVAAESGTAAANLVASGIATRATDASSTRIYIDGTKVEIIDTYSISPDAAREIDPDEDRLFVLAHRWALDSATGCTISVTETPVEIRVPVATPAALVATKTHAIQSRHDDRKKASDALDLYRLLDAHNGAGEMAAAFAAAPDELTPLVADAVDRVFRNEVTRTLRWIRSYGDRAWVDLLTEDALSDAASDFRAAVDSLGAGPGDRAT